MAKKLIVYFSPTGLTPTRESIHAAGLPNVELPYSPPEIASTIKATHDVLAAHCRDIGMIVHVHIRDESGKDTLAPIQFNRLHGELVKLGLRTNGTDRLGLFYTSSVPNASTPVVKRASHILHAPTHARPMGGTGLWGNFAFGRSRFYNDPREMRQYASALQKKNMVLENEVVIFSDDAEGNRQTQEMTDLLVQAIEDHVFDKPVYVNIVVGPSGLDYEHISKKAAEIKNALVTATKKATIEGHPLIIIGGAISPEETVRLAVTHNFDGIRFGAGECRANANCTWADTSPHLAEKVIEQAKKSGAEFATIADLNHSFARVGLSV